jgi:hypothetical protein
MNNGSDDEDWGRLLDQIKEHRVNMSRDSNDENRGRLLYSHDLLNKKIASLLLILILVMSIIVYITFVYFVLYYSIIQISYSNIWSVLPFVIQTIMLSVVMKLFIDRTKAHIPKIFKIYEKGCAVKMEPPKYGLFGSELFLYWEDIDYVSLSKKWSWMDYHADSITMGYVGSNKLILDKKKIGDPFQVILLFKKYIPEKMGKEFEDLLEKEDDIKFLKVKPTFDIDIERMTVGIVFVGLASLPFLNILILEIIYETSPLSLRGIVFILLNLVLGIPILYLSFILSVVATRESQEELILDEARATDKGIKFPKGVLFFEPILLRVRDFIDYNEIKALRLKLNNKNYTKEGEVEISNGARVRVPYNVFLKISKEPQFIKKGFDYEKKPAIHSKKPIISSNIPGTILFHMLFGIVFCILIYTFAKYGGGLFVFSLCPIILFIFVIIYFAIIEDFIKGRKFLIDVKVKAKEDGISVSDSNREFMFIPKDEIKFINVKKYFYGLYLEVTDKKGFIIGLPYKYKNMLAENGYPFRYDY